ncbi:hypothetical protein C7410_14738 [Paraburkholderia silvatlantica]|uniref:GcrA cell cycle regulator n=1 Tax=Paraburkholderia silvatlantica TaxID=321895 RepID=A0A2V4TQ52_9BURK|nr:hypothetical protein [Paraburkholderia silvatlantica]PYE13383.1 hypothetical protein C7410_14738 [Paraburkholderia silvatlantica]
MGATRWTNQETADLIRVWTGKENLKRSLHLFQGRSYKAVIQRAHTLKLGPRPYSDRGVVPFARVAVLRELKKNGPGDIPDLARRTRLTNSIIARYFKPSLGGEEGEFHVTSWNRRPQGGAHVPVYKFGPGENAPNPGRRTTAELCRAKVFRDRAKRMASGERPRFVNPFATAAGLVSAPHGETGRVFKQPMDIDDRRHSREVA